MFHSLGEKLDLTPAASHQVGFYSNAATVAFFFFYLGAAAVALELS